MSIMKLIYIGKFINTIFEIFKIKLSNFFTIYQSFSFLSLSYLFQNSIGRCGRFGKPGFAITLIDATKPRELDQVKKLETHFERKIPLLNSEDSEQFKKWED